MSKATVKERMTTYLEGLEDGEYETAAAQFTEDVTYFHPLVEDHLEGRDALVEFWEDREDQEGATDTDHFIDNWVIDGETFGVQGHMEGPQGATHFLAYGEMRDGKIAYYMPGLLHDTWE
jgi:hypothetical protein